MPTIADVRKQYPDLDGLDDGQVVDALHQAFYPDLSRDDIAAKLGVKPPAPAPETSSMLRRTLGDTGVSLLRGAIGVPEAAVGIADLATGGAAGRAAEAAGVRFKDAKDIAADWYSPEYKRAQQEVQNAHGIVDTCAA